MSPFAPWSVYKNRVSEGTTLILTLGAGAALAVSSRCREKAQDHGLAATALIEAVLKLGPVA